MAFVFNRFPGTSNIFLCCYSEDVSYKVSRGQGCVTNFFFLLYISGSRETAADTNV
jgi:hypothetical protein